MEKIIHERMENKESTLPNLVTTPFTINPLRTKIDKSNFIYVPQKKVFITKIPFEMKERRLDWKESNYFLADIGLFMPDLSIFITHYTNLRNASQDRKDIYDANGSEISLSSAYDLWNQINNYNARSGYGCATWLNNTWKIKKATEYGKEDEIIMTKESKVRRTKEGLELRGHEIKIKIPPSKENYYGSQYNARLPFDDEGLPTEWVENGDCAPGITVNFILPTHGKTTQYYAGEKNCFINCSKEFGAGPAYLFACAHSTKSIK